MSRPIDAITNRQQAIKEGRCVSPPFGCGKKFDKAELRDKVQKDEYEISGFCPSCQDEFFSDDE